MMYLCVCMCLLALVPSGQAYPYGVPIAAVPQVCTDMNPSGHGATAQAVGTTPFEIVTNQNCYKDGQGVQVVVRTRAGQSAQMEGMFVMARRNTQTAGVGAFDIQSDAQLTLLTCSATASEANSAVGHIQKLYKTFKTMKWTPPNGLRQPVKLLATVVQEKDTFWVALEAPLLNYNAECVAGAIISKSPTLKAAPYCLIFGFVSFIFAIFVQ